LFRKYILLKHDPKPNLTSMDKLLLTLNKPGIKLHSISVMSFLFLSGTASVTSPNIKKRLSELAFSFADFSQKIHTIFRRKSVRITLLIKHDYFAGFLQNNIIKKTKMNLKLTLKSLFLECNSVCHMNLSVHPFLDLGSSN
jgi:hypothetical protein